MICIHCGGNHNSDYCMGYNSDSMNKSLSEINQGIDILSSLNEKALDQASDNMEVMLDANEKTNKRIEKLSDDFINVGNDISNSINNSTLVNAQGYDNISNSILKAGHDAMIGSIVAGSMIKSELIGIGAILQFREQMEQLRHKDKLKFDEEESIAGKARRELKTASTLLFVGDPNQAEYHIKNSLNFFPSSAETFRLKSISESRQGKHSEAIISLKASLKLAEDNCLYPSLLNIDESITKELYERVFTSSLAQISQEFSLIGKLNNAIEYLDNGVNMFHENSDLQFQRIRVLSRTQFWERYFEKYITNLVELSPKHFNILYSDLQLRRKKKEIRVVLNKIKIDKQQKFENKKQALSMLSQGNSEQLNILNNQSHMDDLSFMEIVKYIDSLTMEIKEYTKK